MTKRPAGVGLGFRRELLPELRKHDLRDIDFFEIAPENWIGAGGQYEASLREFTEAFPFTCHGLSLSIGSTDPLDLELLRSIKNFMRTHRMELYTEHLSWCSHNGHLYDLLPIPCTEEAVQWVSGRIKQVQDILEIPIGIENASYYFAPPQAQMSEEAFISAIVAETGCFLHLDVNNVYVNSQNFGFDARHYLQALPLHRVGYLHVAGHYVEDDGLIVDTHGANVIDPVWALLAEAYNMIGGDASQLPTCLERDFNFPEFTSLQRELRQIRELQNRGASAQRRPA